MLELINGKKYVLGNNNGIKYIVVSGSIYLVEINDDFVFDNEIDMVVVTKTDDLATITRFPCISINNTSPIKVIGLLDIRVPREYNGYALKETTITHNNSVRLYTGTVNDLDGFNKLILALGNTDATNKDIMYGKNISFPTGVVVTIINTKEHKDILVRLSEEFIPGSKIKNIEGTK